MRTIPLTDRVPEPDTSRLTLALAAGLGLGYVVLVLAAIRPSAAVFLAAGVVVIALEAAVADRAPFASWVARRVGVGAPWRGLLRLAAVLVLLARAGTPTDWVLAGAVGLGAVTAVRAVGYVLSELVARQRTLPIVTRGLSLAPVQIPAAPHPLVGRHLDLTLGCPDLLVVAGAAVAVLSGGLPVLVVGTVLAAALTAAATGLLGYAAFGMRRVTRPRLQAAVARALDKAEPQVALYFGGGPDTLYQLEMWVETVERLEVSALLVLRDRESLLQLGPTRLPVICVEHGTPLMALQLPHLRVALYVAHSANNLNLLRRRGVRHVFIGHGDSDKAVTVNPFLKAYDEIWVSGPAARERFRTAQIGLDEARIVEIGRPQLDGLVEPQREVETEQLTVLYAPSWEGYGDEPHQTSLGPCGLTLVHLLLAEPDVRIIYRPHPLAGSGDPAVARAHREIVELLGVEAAPEPVAPSEAYAGARDALDVARFPVLTSRSEQVAALDVWAGKQLAPEPGPDAAGRGHVLAPDPQFGLYACFAAADVLLCDVSSVITDFLASDRPYGVTNPAGLSAGEFAVRYPSSRGGYLVDADGHGLAGLLAAGRKRSDPAAPARAGLRDQLLGPSEPPALERMRKAVAAAASALA